MTGEERERKMLEDQIARAKTEAETAEKEAGPSGLQKREGEKITLNLFAPPQSQAQGQGSSTSTTGPDQIQTETGAGGSETGSKPLAMGSLSFGSLPSAPAPITNPLKRPAPMNVFKSAKAPKPVTDNVMGMGMGMGMGKQKQLSEVERLMKEDQARKARGGYQGQGPRRG
jgi:DNA/RNA-binding protein KIN17